MPSNSAAWLTGQSVTPLEVKSAPYTNPGPDEIVIKNSAVAINPIDWILQTLGTSLAFPWIKYPFVLGSDVAGEVVEVGSEVAGFKTGDRVVGHALSVDKQRHGSPEGGFQQYTVLLAHMTSPIPSTMSYEEASVLPLGISTAACALFQTKQLSLQYPSAKPTSTGKTLLVWGGSTSVGCNAIQLAVAAGYEVFTTASPKNFDYVKSLGAARAFDYNSKTVIPDITSALQGKLVAGAVAIGKGSAEACMDILGQCEGDKAISMATFPIPLEKSSFFLVKMIYAFVTFSATIWIKSKLKGVRYQFIEGASLAFDGLGKTIYNDYLPSALEEGRYTASPSPLEVGTGLDYIQAAMDLSKQGVSAKKVVVKL